MGNQDSKAEAGESLQPQSFVSKLQEVGVNAQKESIETWRELWAGLEKEHDEKYDESLVENNVLKSVAEAFRSSRADWRQEGIRAARKLFHVQKARAKLLKLDFLGSVLLITWPDAAADAEDDENYQQLRAADLLKEEEQHSNTQLLAAETICDMADYPEFLDLLCSTGVLNFLCIILTQVPQSVELVTLTFVKMSGNEKNLVVLTENGMGDSLETFFKSVHFVKPEKDDEEDDSLRQWYKDVAAMRHSAHTLGTLIKYNHRCRVDLPTIFKVFRYALGMERQDDDPRVHAEPLKKIPDNTLLLSELCRLFYWVCRRSSNILETLYEASPYGRNDEGLDFVLKCLAAMWKRCNVIHEALKLRSELGTVATTLPRNFEAFRVDDLDRLKPLDERSEEFKKKEEASRLRLCYLNCTIWVLLPIQPLRWKLRDVGITNLKLAFELRDYLLVILGTVRFVVDLPESHEAVDFMTFFAEQLIALLDNQLNGIQSLTDADLRLLLDAISILGMQRDMQVLLAQNDIYDKLMRLLTIIEDPVEKKKIEKAVLRTLAEVSMHPSHRLSWVATAPASAPNSTYFNVHPPREKFKRQLQDKMKDTDDNIKTIASLLLTIFSEGKFKNDAADIESTIRSVLDWWRGNTTARYEEQQEAYAEAQESGVMHNIVNVSEHRRLQDLVQRAIYRREQHAPLTSMDTMRYCAPHECVLALSLFSRLALEPRFKGLFYRHGGLQALLECVCVGIWTEAREAAAALANLLWVPDLNEEALVCWLKFDSPRCVALDASNVLVPIKQGTPKPADLGKGMYKSSWGVEFVDDARVVLHPDGLKTYQVPGCLTTASPSDTFACTSRKPYEWLCEAPHPKCFSITCWFYWPLASTKTNKVLLQSSVDKVRQIYWDEEDPDFRGWTLVDENKKRRRLTTPGLDNGWHMLALVSSYVGKDSTLHHGTRFYLDDWHCELEDVWVSNDFYQVGNAKGATPKPFGLITDFRIYARVLREEEVKQMCRVREVTQHPDRLARELAEMDAATILAQRLDVPDCAAECLRALGSLATLSSQRAKIFSVCGRRVLQLFGSPLPMVQRQAARLVNNIA